MYARAAALSLVLALAGIGACASAPPPTATTTGRAMAERIEGKPGLENLARVDGRLYRGAQPTAEGYRQLKAMGVKTVVTFRSHHSARAEIESAGLACVEIPVQADVLGSEPPTDVQLEQFFDVVLDASRGPVFIHCKAGKDRTGTFGAVYRMEMEGWSNAEAIQEMQAFGFHDIYVDLMNYVRAYKLRGYASRQ